jgi:formylglycine-generating enzyme required for sulfatase activity
MKLTTRQFTVILFIICFASVPTSQAKGLAGKLIHVKGGCFQMGDIFAEGDSDERPTHKVCLDNFSIGKYEVTQGQWQAIMGNNPSHFKKGNNYPVEMVSWQDTQKFIRKLNKKTKRHFRLPTEAEWEYAARSGGKQELYSGGNRVDPLAWFERNSKAHTHPVGKKSPNHLGIYDMSGNVWEWVNDLYTNNYYQSSPERNPQGPDQGLGRIFRGGCWEARPRHLSTTYRYWFSPRNKVMYLGFRLAEGVSAP